MATKEKRNNKNSTNAKSSNSKGSKGGAIKFLGITTLLGVVSYVGYRVFGNSNKELPGPPSNVDNIERLHPKIRKDARKFIIDAAEQGYELMITSGLIDQYAHALMMSRFLLLMPWLDLVQNYGLAFTVKINGADWDMNDPALKEVQKIAAKHGFQTSMDYGSVQDEYTFEKLFGKNKPALKRLYNAGLKDGYIKL